MNKIPVEKLLRWRLSQAEKESPPAPRAAQLLKLVRPWWETWPEQFQSLVKRVGRIQIAFGHAMTESDKPRSGHPVPTVVVSGGTELETSVRILYLNVHDGQLHLRFQLDATVGDAQESFEATFVGDDSMRPLLSGDATVSVASEYRIDAELSDELARAWVSLKVTDRMPFRLILHSNREVG